jgi:Na+/H+ antiporter NhaC
MLSEDSWQTIATCGLVLSGIAGVTSGPWAALVFTVLYGAAILSILRLH